jgi:hypothetical protein
LKYYGINESITTEFFLRQNSDFEIAHARILHGLSTYIRPLLSEIKFLKKSDFL